MMMMSARCVVVVASTLLLPLLVALLGRLASAYPRAPLLHFAGRGGLVRRQAAQRRDRQQPGGTGSFDGGYTAPRKKGLVDKVLNVLNPRDPGALILVRHGQTTMNYNRSFTGQRELEHAARLLMERGFQFDAVYTSKLKRAIRSSWIILRETGQMFRPAYATYRLNERMYGMLEGASKAVAACELGEDVVQEIRTGLYTRPPPMTPNHPHWHATDAKYWDLDPSEIPLAECLFDTIERTRPLLEERILPEIRAGKTIMVVAHANAIRGICKYLDDLSEDELKKVAIPNGCPVVYRFTRDKDHRNGLKPVPHPSATPPLSGEFLEQKNLLKILLKREADLLAHVPGFDPDSCLLPENGAFTLMGDTVVKGLQTLERQRQYGQQLMDLDEKTRANVTAEAVNSVAATMTPAVVPAPAIIASSTSPPILPPLATAALYAEAGRGGDPASTTSAPSTKKRDDPVLVIIRHGNTEYNKLGIFTGWLDVPLSDDGRKEAIAAGRLLKRHGIEFDVVYTSWLSRVIETAWLVLDELDSLWLPIIKSWRLNERMYGGLTGLSKAAIKEKYGEEQFHSWRRGYNTPPPSVSSWSSFYPGNDDRYVTNVDDIRYSVFESVMRTVGHRQLQLHRKFPKSESLQDCMSRTIPFFTNEILPQSIDNGKNVLVVSSENAIRGLLMHLCAIPPENINQIEIPMGVPIVYNLKTKCVQLLDDGGYTEFSDPSARYNFGSNPELIFRPCEADDTECFWSFDSGSRSFAFDPLIRLPPPPPGSYC